VTTTETETAPGPRSTGDRGVATSVHPVVPGFHPDPTVCRVGDDYYLANSSFEYAPAVPLWHSRDLLTWRLLGNVLDRPEQFAPGAAGASKGVYAPTLRHHDGRFWLITTDVSGPVGQIVVHAEDPAGPWSDPLVVPGLHGIDPDLAWDEDGTCYVTYCSTDPGLPGICQARVDLATGAVLTAPRRLWSGTGLAFPEAPHLYRRGGTWYLMIAEGGTERGHAVSIARGERPDGPFEPAPGNPFLSHRSTTHPVQNTGHADLVENADGTWAMVYLGVRPRGVTPMFHVNGRETFLAGVDWVDGWPVVDELRYVRPLPDHSFTDAFPDGPLHPRWVSPGAAPDAFAAPRPGGGLDLRPAATAAGAPAALTTRVLDHDWSVEVDLDLDEGGGALLVRLDDHHWCEVRVSRGRAHAVVRIGPVEAPLGDPVPVAGTPVTLGARSVASATSGPDDLLLGLVVAGAWHELARVDGRYLSTEVAGGFTGRTVGARALDGRVGLLATRYRSHPATV
jgi:hypothetical protein